VNFGEWLQLATWDVKAFFGDKDSKVHAASLREVNAQKTPIDREIYQTVEAEKIEFGGFLGLVRGIGTSAGQGITSLIKMLSFVLRFFPLILIVFGLFYLIFYVKIFEKLKT
jgi:hypothetical protein